MPHFVFKAKKPSGEVYSGERDFNDRYELYRMIRENGEEVVEFKEDVAKSGFNISIPFNPFSNKVKTIEKINFARNLGSMLQAGLPLSRAIQVIERQSKNKGFKSVLQEVGGCIDRGTTFADALSKHPKVFPQIFVSMVHAGEQSGTLAESLKVVGTQMDSSYTLEKKVRGSLMYPSVIVSVMILIAILMFVFVVPTLLKTFTELNVPLPLMTRMVLGISNIIRDYGLLVLIFFIMIIGSLIFWSKKDSGKKVIHALLLKIPVIGGLVQEVNAARTARTMASLLSSGVDVVESVSITASVVQNVHFKAVLNKATESIKKGELMSKIFTERSDLYPVFFSEMINVGEETGKTGEMLLGVAHYYEEDVQQKTKDMSTIIEPFLIVIIGLAVGIFALSMIQPMYSLVNVI